MILDCYQFYLWSTGAMNLGTLKDRSILREFFKPKNIYEEGDLENE